MSLTVKEAAESSFEPIPEGTYSAVCHLLVDLGVQHNKAFDNSSRKVMLGWLIPEETYVNKEGFTVPRAMYATYTASIGKKAKLRSLLASWRGRDFTADELEAFNLRNIVGAPCLMNIIHTDGKDGRTYANIAGIMRLPKGMQAAKLSTDPIIFDLDEDPLENLELLPEWIANKVKESETYMDKAAAQIKNEVDGTAPAALEEIPDGTGEDELPF
jgi:hypothetical protein